MYNKTGILVSFQRENLIWKQINLQQNLFLDTLGLMFNACFEYKSVSYTHLDVYKRQRIPHTPVTSIEYTRILFVCVWSLSIHEM